jgi:hypothetical protein
MEGQHCPLAIWQSSRRESAGAHTDIVLPLGCAIRWAQGQPDVSFGALSLSSRPLTGFCGGVEEDLR